MGRPCTCVECQVCGEGKCDCTCANGPHLGYLDLYSLRVRLKDMSEKQRTDFISSLTKDLDQVW